MSKKITMSLSSSSIDKAIKEVEEYRIATLRKTRTLRQRIAEEIGREALKNFSSAVIEDTVKNGTRNAEVSVTTEEFGDISLVIAHGEDAVWVEFGSGVYHNGATGTSPNPYGNDLGFAIGTYGKGYGKRKVWGYYDGGELILTRGTPAQRPMFLAVSKVCADIINIAKEVFSE